MRMTESRLRRIIRSVIEESWREHSKIDSIRQGKSLLEGQQSLSNSKVQDEINYYKNNPEKWPNARYAFFDMKDGGSGGVIEYAEDDVTPIKKRRDEYPGWTDEMFSEVIKELDDTLYYDFLGGTYSNPNR